MADNNKVTIDAAWFAELYAKWKCAKSGERPCDGCPIVGDLDGMRAECGRLSKERDELNAKLAQMTKFRDECERQFQEKCNELFAANSTNSEQADQLRDALNENEDLKAKLEAEQSTNANIGIVYAMKWKNKLAAAERCIEDIANIVIPNEKYLESSYKSLNNIIRAYREKKAK